MSRHRGWLLDLGVTPYDLAHALQLDLVDRRQRQVVGDTLILLEHAPIITLGRRADESHILASRDLLAREGIAVQRVERGGDVTYHGPGQLVGYPILHLPSHRIGASDYMHRLESVLALTCADYGIQTHCRDRTIGVWVGDNKIAALGVRIKRGVTFHGLALNVNPNMAHWRTIVPCGITDGGVTSLAQELATAPSMQQVKERLVAHFSELFHVDLTPTTWETLLPGAQSRQ